MTCHRAIVWKCDVIRKTLSTQCIAAEDDQAMAIINMHKKVWVKFGSGAYKLCEWTDRQINTHTHNRFTAGLEYVRVHPGQQVPER